MELKHLTYAFEMKETKEDSEFFYFEGYGATFGNVDHGGDVIQQGAFKNTLLKNRVIPVLYQHNSREPIGIYTDMKEDSHGLYVKGKLPKDDALVRDRIIPQMKVGSIAKMSIGYTVIDRIWQNDIRVLKEVDLFEISLVTFPMNDQANITGMKAAVPFQDLPLADRSRSWDSAAAVQRVRAFTNSNEKPSAEYKKAFLWYDSASSELFGSYKLPIADVIDGKLVAVPRAIFAAAAALSGARGGVDLPTDDRASVIANVEKYYSKMDMESPFGDKINKSRVETCVKSIREAEEMLREAGFSQSGSKAFISIIRSAGDAEEKQVDFLKALASLNK